MVRNFFPRTNCCSPELQSDITVVVACICFKFSIAFRASELLYEEGDVLICRVPGPVDIAAADAAREAAAGGINVHSKASCLQASIDPRHFRLCLVCERVRRKGGDGNDLFLARWYHAQASRPADGTTGLNKADVNTVFVLDDENTSVLVDRSDVYRRLRSGAAGAHAKGSLVVRGVTLKSRGGQDGKDAATMAGAALHSDATTMPDEMVLTDQEWIQVVQTIVSYLVLPALVQASEGYPRVHDQLFVHD